MQRCKPRTSSVASVSTTTSEAVSDEEGAVEVETIGLSNGTTMELVRVREVDDPTWAEMKAYLKDNPEIADNLRSFSKNPKAVRGWMQTLALQEYYSEMLSVDDPQTLDKIRALASDPELWLIFEEARKGGFEDAARLRNDDDLMLAFSRKMDQEAIGRAARSVYDILPRSIHDAAKTGDYDILPRSIHDAAKTGDLHGVQEYLHRGTPIDIQCPKGITAFGYAIGANRIALVTLLLDNGASPHSVDFAGNSALHYAAGYGRKLLAEFLIRIGAPVNLANAQGQTPFAVAQINRHPAVLQLLSAHGGDS